MKALFAALSRVAWYLQIAAPLFLYSCNPLGTPPAADDPALASMAVAMRPSESTPHRDVPPSFSETREGTCALKLSQDFEDKDAVVNVSVGDKLKVTYQFRLCKSGQKGHVLCAQKDMQVPCEEPMTYECQVAFFDKDGTLLGTDRAFGCGLSPKSPSFFNATETHDILTIEGLADQVASYKLAYYEFGGQEAKKEASGDAPAGILGAATPQSDSSAESSLRTPFRVYGGYTSVPGGTPGWAKFYTNPTLTFSETKEGTCTLKPSQSFDDQDLVVNVPVGDKLEGAYRFRLGESFQNQRGLFTEQEFKNPSDKTRTYECHVAFFDKEGKLLGCHIAESDQPLDAGSSGKTPCLLFFSTGGEKIAEQVASYKLTYLEFEIEEFKPTGGSDGRPGLRSPVL